MLQPLSLWHFIFYLSVWLAFFAAVFNAVTGILGMSAVKPKAAKWPKWVWLSFGFGLLLAIGIGRQTAEQLQDADLQKRVAQSNATNFQTKLNNVDTNVRTIAEAMHIPVDQSTGKLLQAIIGKLTIESSATGVLGSDNKTGVIAGAGSHVTGNQIHIGDNIYVNNAGHRTIRDKARQQIISELSKSSPAKVAVINIGSDPEVAQFGQQLADILQAAGWDAETSTEINAAHSATLLGLFLGVKDTTAAPVAAKKLLDALSTNGIKISPVNDNTLKDNTGINLVIGGKP